MSAIVTAVSRSATHTMRKAGVSSIRVLPGIGVEGDAHAGTTVKHRSRVARDATQPNLRQVHLIQSELHDELRQAGFEVAAGDLGENVTTRGVDLLALAAGTRLHLGDGVIVAVTGTRNPCVQIDKLEAGLLAATKGVDESGRVVLRAAVMGIVVVGGEVRPGDSIRVEPPEGPRRPLAPV